MCGGDIQFNPGDTNGQCDHCGCTTTFPKLPDEQKANLFNRANHFRRQCEFDKAMAAYEHILEEDDTEAEAHWGIVLSKFGIEYVEDPVTHERIPTCHRAQVISILSDEDYQNALKYAPDTYSREIYEKEAKKIAEIQKGILAISSQEKPYDVFICYKETDDSGSRTKDSTLAQEIYYQLTNEGYKVFFSRITLEDKLGQQYEPYIFAALNSAKVMVVIGTKPEYFNAVWVKNEWSRYLHLMRNDRKRLLIPCYRDMDPYDLPEELGNLQSQDMSRIGFMQDLLRGVRKVLEADKEKQPVNEPIVQKVITENNNANALLDRAFLCLEDGDFSKADDFCEQALNLDAHNSRAYLIKLMVERQVRKVEDLSIQKEQLDTSPHYQRAVRFATPEQKKKLEEWNQTIISRNEHIRKYRLREKASVQLKNAETVEDCQAVREILKPISDFEQVDDLLKACDTKEEEINEGHYQSALSFIDEGLWEKAITELAYIHGYKDADKLVADCESSRKKKLYEQAIKLKNSGVWDSAIRIFSQLKDYDDSLQQIENCKESKLNEEKRVKEEKEQEERRKKQEQEQKRIIAERQEKARIAKKRRLIAIVISVLVIAVAGFFVVTKVIIPKGHYDTGMSLRASERWNDAVSEFEKAANYSDSEKQILVTRYMEGESKREAKNWEGAVTAFNQAGEYSDAKTQILVTRYEEGVAKRTEKDWNGAVNAFKQARNHSDALTQINETYYQEAKTLLDAGKQEEAYAIFLQIKNYKDSLEIACKPYYDAGIKALQEKKWDSAVSAFEKADDYSDAKTQILVTRYEEGTAKREAKDWDGAVAAFELAGSYNDAASQVLFTRYTEGKEKRALKDWDGAVTAFTQAGNYDNAKEMIITTRYEEAQTKYSDGDWQGAIEAYKQTYGSFDANSKIPECYYRLGKELFDNRNYSEAKVAFTNAGEYSDAKAMLQECDYQEAIKLVQNGEKLKAKRAFMKIWKYRDSMEYIAQINNLDHIIAASEGYIIGLKGDGTAECRDWGDYAFGGGTNGWKNVVAVDAGDSTYVGLTADGRAYATGRDNEGQDKISSCNNLVAVEGGFLFNVGLKADGTIVGAGNEEYFIDAESWTDIVSISSGGLMVSLAGIKADGTVVTLDDELQEKVKSWNDIVSIDIEFDTIVGLKSDGTVVVASTNRKNKFDVSSWTDIVAVSTNGDHVTGLKKDGTVLDTYFQDKVKDWTDIIAIETYRLSGDNAIIGIKSNGTIVVAGYGTDHGYLVDLFSWRLFADASSIVGDRVTGMASTFSKSADEYRHARVKKTTRIRSEAKEAATSLGNLEKDTEVQIIEIFTNNKERWAKIKDGETIGYVKYSYLELIN